MVKIRARRGAYLTQLALRNIKSFAGEHILDLTNERGDPARWTLLLGDNGVGKTTLLECIARLRPTFNSPDASGKTDPRLYVEPWIAREENEVIVAMGRNGDHISRASVSFAVNAFLERPDRNVDDLVTSISFRVKNGEPEQLETSQWPDQAQGIPESKWKEFSKFDEPLVLAYGAGRHMGVGNFDFDLAPDPTESLFDSSIELFDAEELLQHFNYAASNPEATKAEKDQKTLLLSLIASLLPEVASAESIRIYAPKALGRKARTGVFVKTADGEVPLRQLSFGYQTMMAWGADIGWRLFQRYPTSKAPLHEPAIVIIDEIDLHLHPKWQRALRGLLTQHFPNVQFVATAHSPLIAQAFLDANLAVVMRDGDHSIIENDPGSIRNWRIDQIVTSELVGLPSPWPPATDRLFEEKRAIVSKAYPTAAEKRRLAEIDKMLLKLPTETNPKDDEAFNIIREAAALLAPRVHKG
jgi:predicted ATP-binding protein involved in virulence